jgi:spermidine/putrescine transport system ATP-binding protein/putrescine transport system ATP-binding protein
VISIRNVSKSFGRVQAVVDVSLDIERGEFFSLLGASGSGKTTLLRMLAGFEGVTAGQIVIDGQPMQNVPPNLRPINMVFQNYAIFPHLNVRDNIAYGLRRLGTSKAQQDVMVDEMLELIALPGYGARRANQLSGGQMQRVALARALILKPKVLLLDEPLGALDKQLREQMQLELRSLQQKLGITFVLVTHDQEEALTLSDRVAVMAQGRVVQVDTPNRLYDSPRNRLVASFVGNMNFFKATLRQAGAGAVAEVEGLGQVHLNGQARDLGPGAAALIALRPEGFSLHDRAPATAADSVAERTGGVVQGKLVARQYLGGRQMLHVQIDGLAAPVAVLQSSTRGAETAALAEGSPVWLTWPPEAVVVLANE